MRIKYKATTYSNHNFKVVPNLLKQDFNVEVPKTVYADDITYMATDKGWIYLATVVICLTEK